MYANVERENSRPKQSVFTQRNASDDALFLNANQGIERKLSPGLMNSMARHFGYDLSGVRFRESSEASRAGGAFTQGNVINFGKGQFEPESHHGRRMIAHEMAHVVQQAKGEVRPSFSGSNISVDGSLERGADNHAEHFLSTGGEAASIKPLPAVQPAAAPVQGWAFRNLLDMFKRKKNKDAGHDLLMPDAIDMANQGLGGTADTPDRRYSVNDSYNMGLGNYFNDVGPNYYGSTMRDDNLKAGERDATGKLADHPELSKTAAGIGNQLKLAGHLKLGRNKRSFAAQTHTGDLQFLHSMKSLKDTNVADTTRRMKLYANFAYGLSGDGAETTQGGVGGRVNLDTRVSELGGTDYADLGFQNVSTLYKKGKMKNTLKEAGKLRSKIDNPHWYMPWRYTRKTKHENRLAKLERRASFMRGEAVEGLNEEDKPKEIRKLNAKIEKGGQEVAALTAKRDALMAGYRSSGRTMREMVGVSGTGGEHDRAAQMRYLGSLSHMAQDSFANSHAFRGFSPTEDLEEGDDISSPDRVMRGVNPILQNADFTKQHEGKHHTADVLAHGERGAGRSRIQDTAGARQARNVSAYIMSQRARGTSQADMGGFFDRLFAADPDATGETQMGQAFEVTGSGRSYRKKELYKKIGRTSGGDQKAVRKQLKAYSRTMKHVERGGKMHRFGKKNRNQTRTKDAGTRFSELRNQAQMLLAALGQFNAGGERNAALKKEMFNDLFEIYKSMQTMRGRENVDDAFIDTVRQRLEAGAGEYAPNHDPAEPEIPQVQAPFEVVDMGQEEQAG